MASFTKYEGKRGTTYKATVRLRGYPTQTETFKRLTDAKKWATDIESDMSNGRHFPTNEARKRTLTELIDRYIRDELRKKPRSEAKQKSQLEWWKKQIGGRTLIQVTPALLAECRDKLINEPYVTIRKEKQKDGSCKEVKTERKRLPPTANRYIAALSHVFTVAVKEWRWLERNPFGNVRRNKESEGIVRFLSDDERDRLLKACKESRNKLLYTIVLLDISSGGRYSEIMKLTWEDVSFELRRIILRDTKNGETRAVPLSVQDMKL